MYGYVESTDITPDQILQKVSQEAIFAIVFKGKIDLDSRYISPFRKDKRPGCYFWWGDSGLFFVDRGDPITTHRGCFKAVMDKFNLNIKETVAFIVQQLGLSPDRTEYSFETTTSPFSSPIRERPEIEISKISFNKRDGLLWSQWLITREQLEYDKVVAINMYKMLSGNKISRFNILDPCYAFTEFIDAVKIFRPYRAKDNGRYITNCNSNHIGNIDNLPPTGPELIIQKSYKDHRVCRNVLQTDCVVWFLSETAIPAQEILENLANRFRMITIFFDNDYAGIRAARKLRNVFKSFGKIEVRIKFIPKRYKLKDPGEFINRHGTESTNKMLEKIKIKRKTWQKR